MKDRAQAGVAMGANRTICDRPVSCVIETFTSEMQTADLGCEDFNERSTEFLVRGSVFTLSGFGAHAKHRHHPG